MKTLLDASSIINLIKGEVFQTVLRLRDRSFFVGPQVLQECRRGHCELLDEALNQGVVTELSDTGLPASLYFELLERHGLGPGETECLAFASLAEFIVCCDDGTARRVLTQQLGAKQVTGSLGLLRDAVHEDLLSGETALKAYELMEARGGFLPQLPSGFFSTS